MRNIVSIFRKSNFCVFIVCAVFLFIISGCGSTTPPEDNSESISQTTDTPTSIDENNEQVKDDDKKKEETVNDKEQSSSSTTLTEEDTTTKKETTKTETTTPTQAVKPTSTTPSGKLTVHYIDVGQGASQLIQTPSGKTMLIDGGNNDDEQRMVSYLNKQGVKKVDVLIGTHPDADHIGGLDAVVDSFDIGKIYMPKVSSNTKTYESLLTSIKNKSLKVTTAKAGINIDLDNEIDIKMIAPVKTYDDKNEMSAVVKLTYGNNSFLFTGDAESGSESDMINSGVNLKSDVLLVGHHGSNSSTSQTFLNAVDPTYAVIQVGNNSYGHPTDNILNRLNSKNIKIYRNDLQGTIIFTSDGTNIKPSVSAWKYTATTNKEETPSESTSTTVTKKEPAVSSDTKTETKTESTTSVYYKNCDAVRAAGKDPLYKGDPGYSTKLDRDKDGIACER
ncbi:MBL fold metallo-hydrolase [Paenibacillus polygoni]|uniref:MBL fold metallo-hydrolase n=1 Tax=Paenibacillus polygoni TaxID=3050112 RepID=A0ABY8X824_9BACL|nr:MBL fold metallo-hydrolase [Paenibacillus polygoni]WIV21208.1 MBL fold metallo-hydrolase [Paenibacillus polygoni]